MDFLTTLNLEQLGTAGIIIGLLLYDRYLIRQELREEREYSKTLIAENKELNSLYQDMAHKVITSLQQFEYIIRDSSK